MVFEDLSAMLANLFDDSERQRCASAILSYLRDHKDVNIKTIAEDTGVSQSMAQKIVAKLLLYKYVSTTHGAGKEKLVSLRPYTPEKPIIREQLPSFESIRSIENEFERKVAMEKYVAALRESNPLLHIQNRGS